MNKSIKAIDKSTVNRICSGQVVLTLATAVKELLENSLDAGATAVQIKLKEYGSESIEVVDNGFGVEESNFTGLTLKHATSKITEFDDLETVTTFGFRGEALSSLCSLGKMTIITRHKNAVSGTRLRFDHNGSIIETARVARQVGTTVIVENLFVTLPVRHKEFLRNLKRDFGKLCQILQAYALLNKTCSINCTNRVGGANRTFLEKHAGSLRDNISSIFGSKQLNKLLEIQTINPDAETLAEFRCRTGSEATVIVTGFISSCEHGVGRSSQDRQFFYINSRPVDSSKISRLVNEIYHQFNRHQYPFVVMDICLASKTVDVNVVPDKRQIMIENEGLVLATIKSSIEPLFRPIPSFMVIDVEKSKTVENIPSEGVFLTGLSKFRAKGAPEIPCKAVKSDSQKIKFTQSLTKYISRTPVEFHDDPAPKRPKIELTLDQKQTTDSCLIEIIAPEPMEEYVKEKIPEQLKMSDVVEIKIETVAEEKIVAIKQEETHKSVEFDEGMTKEEKEKRRKITHQISLDDIIKMRRKPNQTEEKSDQVKFFAKIEPSANKRAEDELQKQLSQTAFLDMKVSGQFNKGFIITRLNRDLFIIDQHATDEKSNFEAISAKKLEMQRLTVPQILNLDAGKEELIQHRADVFRYNGFDFNVVESAPTTKRIHLTAVPSIQGVTFDHRDVDELLFLLADAPEGQMCRPSRVRDVIASKACRMSVMIGTALNHAQMKRLVHRMSELKQPWNCPHGRPTIRHLVSLEMLEKSAD